MKRRIVIGDIHGCYVELIELLDRIGLGADDQLISVGDAVDRGPDTPGVIAFFQNRPDSVVLVGNHERKHIRGILSYSQQITRLQLGGAYAQTVSWMKTLPYYYETDEAIIVHAAIEPDVPLAGQKPEILCGSTSGERALRQRFGDRPWFESYQGPKPIIFGHHTFPDGPMRRGDLVFGIDTGACRGGALTAIILPSFDLVSVKAKANHWCRVAAEWRLRVLRSKAWEHLPWDTLVACVDSFGRTLRDEAREEGTAELEKWSRLAVQLPRRLIELAEREYARFNSHMDNETFALAVRGHPLERLLFRRRRGPLTEEAARRAFRTPAAALEALERLAVGDDPLA